jgi:hypothetical protein
MEFVCLFVFVNIIYSQFISFPGDRIFVLRFEILTTSTVNNAILGRWRSAAWQKLSDVKGERTTFIYRVEEKNQESINLTI